MTIFTRAGDTRVGVGLSETLDSGGRTNPRSVPSLQSYREWIKWMNQFGWKIWWTHNAKYGTQKCKLITSPFFSYFLHNGWLQKGQELFWWRFCMLGAHLETLADAELQFWYLTICILYFISKLPQLQMVIFIPERASFQEIPPREDFKNVSTKNNL